jgi:hypothetical protein
MDCRDYFASLLANNSSTLAKDVEKAFPNGVCEPHSVSRHSPGRVTDSELVYRQIFSPIHIDPDTQEVVPQAFEDASSKGMSTNRASYITFRNACLAGERKAAADRDRGKVDRKFIGIIRAQVKDVRAIEQENRRAFFVYDTASASVTSHADICQAAIGRRDQRAQARVELSKAFSKKPERHRLITALADAIRAARRRLLQLFHRAFN